MRRRPELFPPDRALQARMAVAMYAAGGLATGGRRRARSARTSPLAKRDERRAQQILTRLAALAGTRAPRLAFVAENGPRRCWPAFTRELQAARGGATVA